MSTAPSDQTDHGTEPVPGPGDRRVDSARSASRRPRPASDGVRYVYSFAVTIVVAAAYGSLAQAFGLAEVGTLRFIVTVYFGAWSIYSLLYAGLTWVALRRADGHQLRQWLAEDRSERRRRRRTEWLAGNGGPLGAVTFCTVAVAAVVCATVLPELRGDPVVVGLAVLVVASSWLLIVAVFAVHYARENAQRGGLEFRGTGDANQPRLADYTYLAIQIGTAYSGGDVIVTDRAMRRTVAVHAVVAFFYNTVLIALLVSLLNTVTT